MRLLSYAVVLLVIPRTILCLACSSSIGSPPVQFKLQASTTTTTSTADVIQASTKTRVVMPRPNLLQRISFGWVSQLMELGNKNPLNVTDLWLLREEQRMNSCSQRYEDVFNTELASMNRTEILSAHKPSLLQSYWASPVTRAIVSMYKKDFLLSGMLKLVNTLIQFLPSLIIAKLLKHIDTHSKIQGPLTKALLSNKGFLLASLLLVTLCAKTTVENQYFDVATALGSGIRGTLSSAVFRKSLRLSPTGRQNNTVGEIVNFSQLDTTRMEYVASSIHILWDGSLQVLGYTCLLIHFLGPSVFAGIFAMVGIIPLNTFFLNKISALKRETLKFADARVRLTNEILQGVRAIKSYNWEKAFVGQLNHIRDQELGAIRAAANTKAVFTSILNAAPSFVAALTLGVYALMGNTLDSTKVFTALALFNQLRFPLIFLPLLFNTLADGQVSLWRLTRFLLDDEIENYVERGAPDKSVAAVMDGASFSWDPHSNTTASSRGRLVNANIEIKRGELVAVVGPVGSGKSTLLSALLGELHKENGRVLINGRVAYVPQSSWIPNDSVRNVILFGKQIDWRRYRNTILACGLSKDLKDFDDGDQTEIGEKGTNLSGGQKQRISIARAVYDDADIYLFDDPLSALDTEVGMRVFRDCVKNLLSKKTRILVTHQLSVLPDADRVIIMGNTDDGGCRIVDVGTFEELLARGHDLSKSFVESGADPEEPEAPSLSHSHSADDLTTSDELAVDVEALSDLASIEVRENVEGLAPAVGLIDLCRGSPDCDIKANPLFRDDEPVAKVLLSLAEPIAVMETSATEAEGVGTGDAVLAGGAQENRSASAHVVKETAVVPDAESKLQSNTAPIKLMTTEERGEGAVSLAVYRSYLKASHSPVLILGILGSFILASASGIGQQWVVAAWTGDAGYKKHPLSVYLGGVTLMAALVGVFNWVRTYITVIIGANASRTIHRDLATSVLRAPLSFFESTPIGRLVQRFSKDLDQIDQQIPSTFGQLVASSLQIASAVVAISIVTPSFVVYMIPVFAMYFGITNYYRNVARELKRLDSLTRSPIYSHFGESLGGLPVIRSFNRQNMYLRTNERKVDDNLSAYNALKLVDRWLCVRLESLGNIIVYFSALLAVLAGPNGGAAGISLNNALSVTSLLNWAVRNGADTESLMNSVERVLYTTNQTPSEGPAVVDEILPTAFVPGITNNSNAEVPKSQGELVASGWPWRGGIVMQSAVMKYRDDFEAVLKGVNLKIAPGESIGIVGRTGSGKSSLLRALLRLTELNEGQVSIDGVDISAIGLDALRSSISIIPQDPVLFSGSVRQNIDPFNTKTDKELWEALEKSNMAATVRNLPGGLMFTVSEGGENFSAGQRQLLCLTRALIRRCRILLLDEATSSVDYETDAFIQRTIRKEFGKGTCTILTIAHRLDTIMDSDRIVVMDRGRVGECDSPAALLRNPNSLFSQLVAADRGILQEDAVMYEAITDDHSDTASVYVGR